MAGSETIAAICSRTCLEGLGVWFVERKILADQRCGDCRQTGMGSQRSEKCLWEISRRQWPERVAGNREDG